jgi:hypothetical protein
MANAGHMAKLKACSDTVSMPISFGKQQQSTRANPACFSFGAGKDPNRWKDGNMKASLTHAEIMKMPVTMFQPHLVSCCARLESLCTLPLPVLTRFSSLQAKVKMMDAKSSFGRQAQSAHGNSENFLFGSSSKLDKLSVDKKLINCADSMVKKVRVILV